VRVELCMGSELGRHLQSNFRQDLALPKCHICCQVMELCRLDLYVAGLLLLHV
jgi:hypothetical protein